MNVVFVNDMRKSVFRRKPVLGVAYVAAAILVLTLGVAQLMPFTGSSSSDQLPMWRLPDFLLPILAPAFAAGAFAKEHEQRTWQDVLLTRLTSMEILSGKFLSSLIPTLIAMSVLSVPLSLLMIIQGVSWAQEPGGWMLVLGAKFMVAAVCYVAVAMVCSYHSPNARIGLAISYGCLMAYGMLNYLLWGILVPFVISTFYGPWSGGPGGRGYDWSGATGGYGSPRTFGLNIVDTVYLGQSLLLAAVLLVYLAVCVRWRQQ